jgi:hypothetical protein
MTTRLIFDPVQRSRRQLVLNYRVDDIRFHTVYWYDTVDFHALEERFGEPFMRKVYFHLLAYEANKAASLKPDVLDLGPYADLYSDAFYDAWITIFRGVWGVWRYDNDIRDYDGPVVAAGGRAGAIEPVTLGGGERLLALCGGGKDSLVSFKLLERAGVSYDAMVYSHNIYGKAQPQHDLIDGMLRHTTAGQVHRGWVYDTALDSPAARLYPAYGVKNILAAETVSSYWTALPIALAHDYTRVALGVTHSTDEHNLVWPETGEAINYLWGMSTAAETLLHDYIRAEIATDLGQRDPGRLPAGASQGLPNAANRAMSGAPARTARLAMISASGAYDTGAAASSTTAAAWAPTWRRSAGPTPTRARRLRPGVGVRPGCRGPRAADGIALGVGEHLPFAAGSFDFILSNEVIEHVADDRHMRPRWCAWSGRAAVCLIFCPNRWYPVEQHGIYWRGDYKFGNIPLVNYLPDACATGWPPRAHLHRHRRCAAVRRAAGARAPPRPHLRRLRQHCQRRWPRAGGLIRRSLYAAEGTPLERAGVVPFSGESLGPSSPSRPRRSTPATRCRPGPTRW